MKIYVMLILLFLSVNSAAMDPPDGPDEGLWSGLQAEKSTISTCSLFCAYYDGTLNYIPVNAVGTSKKVAAKKLINICKSKATLGGGLVIINQHAFIERPVYHKFVSDKAGVTEHSYTNDLKELYSKRLTEEEVELLSRYVAKNYCDSL